MYDSEEFQFNLNDFDAPNASEGLNLGHVNATEQLANVVGLSDVVSDLGSQLFLNSHTFFPVSHTLFPNVEPNFSENAGTDDGVDALAPFLTRHNVTAGDLIQFAAAIGLSNCPGAPTPPYYPLAARSARAS